MDISSESPSSHGIPPDPGMASWITVRVRFLDVASHAGQRVHGPQLPHTQLTIVIDLTLVELR